MTRLTNDIRANIAAALVGHKFQAEHDALADAAAEFAFDVRGHVYGNDLARMESLPNGWLPLGAYLTASFRGRQFRVDFSGNFLPYGDSWRGLKRRDAVCVRVAYAHKDNRVDISDHELSAKFESLGRRQARFTDDVKSARLQIDAALASVSSIAKLTAAWPEVEPFAAKYATARAALPAVPVATLNAVLGLPVEVTDAAR